MSISAVHMTEVQQTVGRQKWGPIGLLIATILYLIYAWGAFNMNEILGKARVEKGILLLSDAVAHKIHVVQDLRRNQFAVAIEGERTATYDETRPLPGWVRGESANFEVDLPDDYRVVVNDRVVEYQVPSYGVITILIDARALTLQLPPGQTALPEGFRFAPKSLMRAPPLRSDYKSLARKSKCIGISLAGKTFGFHSARPSMI